MQKSTRVTPRFAFTAPAEIFLDEGAGKAATVKELSQNGCFLEFNEPYPVGTRVLLKICARSEVFEANARVIYAKPELGMAVAFLDVKPAFLLVLQRWSLAAMRRGETSIP